MPEDQQPKNRKAIKNSMRVWDFLSPAADDDAFTKNHHFTVGVTPERIEAALTIPNASFRKFTKYAGSLSTAEFAGVINQFLTALQQADVLKSGGRPMIVMVQRRYRNMTQYVIDGRVEFDLRTWSGSPADATGPEIKRQPEWLEFCHKLVTERGANIQFQLGVWFPYENSCPAVKSRAVIELIKSTMRAAVPIVRLAGYDTLPARKSA